MKNQLFEINAITDKGNVRSKNEDNFFVNDYFLSFAQSNSGASYREEINLPFVAGISDGMGGEKAGEEAAFTAVSNVYKCFRRYEQPLSHCDIKECINEINRLICTNKPKSGATLAMIYAHGQKLTAVSIGDSRIYHYSKGRLNQISTDHTLAQMQVDAGLITKEEARESKLRHGLTQFLGVPQEEMFIKPDVRAAEISGYEDIILLCSDGLSDTVEDSEIEQILSEDIPLKTKTEKLVKIALDNGGKDNITVMTIKAV